MVSSNQRAGACVFNCVRRIRVGGWLRLLANAAMRKLPRDSLALGLGLRVPAKERLHTTDSTSRRSARCLPTGIIRNAHIHLENGGAINGEQRKDETKKHCLLRDFGL